LEVTITNMRVEHIPAVVELERKCQLSSREAEGYAKLLHESASVLLVSLSEDSKVIGAFSGWLVADEFEIDNVAVASAWRKAGVGSKLLTAALQLARQKGAVRAFLEVRSNNSAARSLYENQGFTLVGRRKNYYSQPDDDALIFSKKIDDPI